jgi:hypothetical protein
VEDDSEDTPVVSEEDDITPVVSEDEALVPPLPAEEDSRQVERRLRKEFLKERLVLEERFERLLKESRSKVAMLEDVIREGGGGAKDGGPKKEDVVDVSNCIGHGLPEHMMLGATMSSQGPIVTGGVKLDTLGTIYEIDRVFRNPAEVRVFFREHFTWGNLDQPLRAGKRVYGEILNAFETQDISCVHLQFRLASVVRASLEKGAELEDGYMELLDALRTAGRPSDFDLFVLDCGGPKVCSSLIAGGGIYLLTFPSKEIKPWQLARIGIRRFQSIVCADGNDDGAKVKGDAEARMIKAPRHVLEGALSVLLKMHVNLTAYPGQQRYMQVPLRSKMFARVAEVEGAAEFLVEHGWVDDGNKILFKGTSKDVDFAVEALERMAEIVAKKKERSCTGMVILEGGSHHGSSFTWEEWKASTASLYQSWLFSVNHRSRMVPLKMDFRELHFYIPVTHPLRPRLRVTVTKGLTHAPAVTDLVFVCADNMGSDLVLRLPHGFIPVVRQIRADRSPIGEDEDLVSLPCPPREKGHRAEMVLCYKTGSIASRLPVTGLRMESGSNSKKGDELVRCVCGLSVPEFAGCNLVASRTRGEKALRSITAVKPLQASLPKGYTALEGKEEGEDFNFLDHDGLESLVIGIKIE